MGSGPSEVDQGTAPSLKSGMEPPIGPVVAPPPGPEPLEAASPSGSTKRKLEAELEEDFLNIYSEVPNLGVRQSADGSTPSQGANFDTDALFASGSEDDEELESDKDDTNQEVEVANLDRPPIAK